MGITAIVAVDKNWAIGKDGKLLFHIREDMQFFQQVTMDNVVIMGRKTYESLPDGPLKNRNNIVITKDPEYVTEGAVVVHSIMEAITEAERFGKRIFCIGGAAVYEQMLPYCDTALVTEIGDCVSDAGVYFPNLDRLNWKLTDVSRYRYDIENRVYFRFKTYKIQST